MSLVTWIADKFRRAPAVAPSKRSTGYFAAEYSRVTSSLVSETRHINEIIRWQGHTLLARSRQLADNNPYASKFLRMVVNNICGPQPFQLQGRVKTAKGKPDDFANQAIETAWAGWSRPGNCDFIGRLSLNDIYRLACRIISRDGECLIRIHEGAQAGPYGIQLQMIDTDRLDFNLNKKLPGGNVIHAGVELDADGRTVAYHIAKRRPVQWQTGMMPTEYERIPADQMIHLFVPLSAEQVRGVPWIYAALIVLHNLGAFEEAAVIAARVGAAKMGFFERDPNFPDDQSGETDSQGARIMDAEPGTFEELPLGLKFTGWEPQYPDAQVGPFIKAALRGVSSALGVSYHSLGNDLEAVNFSSARAGILEEREEWMQLQNWFIEHACTTIYERWLAMASLSGKLRLNGPLDKYAAVYFQPRRWQWVDPLKDVQANIQAIQWGLKSRTRVVSEGGEDIEDVFDQLAAEASLAEAKGVGIQPQQPEPAAPADEPEPQDDNGGKE